MSSLAAFIFLVVIPIWSVATIIVRWIEARSAKSASEAGYLITPEEMARRITLLEEVLKADRSRVVQ
jgi:hypothetical protein